MPATSLVKFPPRRQGGIACYPGNCSGWMLFAAALVLPALAPAGERTLTAALEAHGGASLRDLRTIATQARLVDSWVEQSRRPRLPWDGASGSWRHAVDFAAERYAERAHWVASGGYPFHSLTVSDGADGFVANLYEGYWRRSDADLRSRILDYQLTLAPLVLRDAKAGSEESDERREQGGSPVAVAATLGDQALTLWVDPDSHRLKRVERTLPGGEHQAIHYGDFERIEGVLFNRSARIDYRGNPVREVRFRTIEPNASVAGRFRRPESLEEHVDDSAPGVRDFSARRLADGTWFIGEGVHYQLFVEFEDFVVALGSVAGVDKRLEELARRIPGKPLRYAVVSHHHRDHLEGVRALTRAGAILLAAPTHESVVRAAAGEGSPAIETVPGERVIADGRRELHILQIGPNSHADEMLAAWLPAERLLFTADLFVQPPERPVRARIPPIRDLAIAIEAFGLDVEQLVDPHSPRVNSASDLETAMYHVPGNSP